jgi:hypothetical protein
MTGTILPGVPDAGDAAMEGPAGAVLAIIKIACPEPPDRPASPGRTADPGRYCFGDVAIRVD